VSFLPHEPAGGLAWYGSFAASTLTHAGVGAFLMFSGMVAFQPSQTDLSETDQDVLVSLEILDADIMTEPDTNDLLDQIPSDAPLLEPDDTEAETIPEQELAALEPDDAALTPDAVDPVAPEEDVFEAAEPVAEEFETADEALVPEQPEPETAEPEPLAPVEPESNVVTEFAAAATEELLPEVTEEADEIQPPETAEIAPLAPEPEPVIPVVEEMAIQDISPIESPLSDFNPLAEGGAAALEPLPESSALALPAEQPEVPAAPLPSSDDIAVLTPDLVSEPETDLVPEAVAEVQVPDETLPVADETEALAEVVEPADIQDIAEPELVQEAEETELALLQPEPQAPEPPVAESEVSESPETEQPAPAPETAQPETDTPAPAAPAVIANPPQSDLAIGALLRRLRATSHEQSTLALPRRLPPGGGNTGALAALSVVGADSGVLDLLSGRVTENLDFTTAQTRELIDPRQCATLDAIRQSDSYPANRIGLSLDAASLTSGETRSGSVLGAGGLFVTLLLIDDNGVVQDMAPFVRIQDNVPRFEAPLARTGPARATRQILLALGTQDSPLDLSAQIGRLAEEVFTAIPPGVLQNAVFGFATIDVR